MSLNYLILAGSLNPGVWSAMCAECVTTCTSTVGLAFPPAYYTCLVGCCGIAPGISLLYCFADDTMVVTPLGEI